MKKPKFVIRLIFMSTVFYVTWVTLFLSKESTFRQSHFTIRLISVEMYPQLLTVSWKLSQCLEHVTGQTVKIYQSNKKLLKLNNRRLGILTITLNLFKSKAIILFEAKSMTKQVTYVQRLERRPLDSKQRL